MAIQNLRSSSAHKRPIPNVLSAGQIAVNTNQASPGLFFKDSNGDLVKVGPVHIGTSAPNSSPATTAADALVSGTVYQILTLGNTDFTAVGASANTVGVVFTATGAGTGTGTVSGQQGNEKGEQWLDTTGGAYDLKIYDGSAWRSQAGEFVNVTGDTMTGALLLDNAASASAPDLSFDGDANTGIYSPGADQIALATSGTNRLHIASDGKVGVGTTSPSELLHLSGTSNPSFQLTATNDTTPQIKWSTNSVDRLLIDSSSVVGARVFVRSNQELRFGTNDTERMRIDSAGNVGVGISSPSAKLDVNGGDLLVQNAGSGRIFIKDKDAADKVFALKVNGDIFSIQDSNNSLGFVADVFKIYKGASESSLVINSSGNVGIGTTAPASSLHISGTGPTYTRYVNTSNTSQSFDVGSNSGGTSFVFENGNYPLLFGTNGTERLRITSDGKLGVGTSSPTATLHVDKDTGSTPTVYINNSGGDSGDGVALKVQASARGTSIGDASVFSVHNNASEIFTVRNDGNVGIGTTSPTQNLHIQDSSGPLLTFDDGTTQFGFLGSYNKLVGSGDIDTFLVSSANGRPLVLRAPTSQKIFFDIGSSEAMRIDSARRLLVGTSSDLSGGDADARLQVNGDAGAQILLSRQDFGALTAGTLIGEVVFRSQASGVSETSALIKCEADATQGSGDKPGRLVFSVTPDGASSPTQRVLLSNDGAFNSFTSGAGIRCNTTLGAVSASGSLFHGYHSSSSTTTGTLSFIVRPNGDVKNSNNSYAAISDIKLKENIVDANSQWNDLKALQVRNYNFKEETGHQTHTQIGLVAQEVETVSPGLVRESPDLDEDGNDLGTVTKSVNYSVLYMKAVKTLQEAMERIETLEQRLSDAGIA